MSAGGPPRWLGFLALAFYGAHLVEILLTDGHLVHLLWPCNVAALAVAVGLMLRSPILNAVGLVELLLGWPLWAAHALTHSDPMWTGPLTHLGTPCLALIGMRRLGLPRHTWWLVPVSMLGLVGVARLVGPPGENVNLAFGLPAGWEDTFPSHGALMLMLATLFIGGSLALQWILPRTRVIRRPDPLAECSRPGARPRSPRGAPGHPPR